MTARNIYAFNKLYCQYVVTFAPTLSSRYLDWLTHSCLLVLPIFLPSSRISVQGSSPNF